MSESDYYCYSSPILSSNSFNNSSDEDCSSNRTSCLSLPDNNKDSRLIFYDYSSEQEASQEPGLEEDSSSVSRSALQDLSGEESNKKNDAGGIFNKSNNASTNVHKPTVTRIMGSSVAQKRCLSGVSVSVIKPKKHKLDAQLDSFQDSSSGELGFDCPICLTGFANRTYVENCFHQFCFLCISSYINKCFPNTLCPLCKQHFNQIYHSYKTKSQSYSTFIENFKEACSQNNPTYLVGNPAWGRVLQNFKVTTCKELFNTPILKPIKSLRELCQELNKRELKTTRDRQLVFEYSLEPCLSQTTSKRLMHELKKTPFSALNIVDFSKILRDQESCTDTEFFRFLKRDVTAILLIIHPLCSDSLLSLTLKQILSALVFNSNKTMVGDSFGERCLALDEYIFPYSEAFLKELTGFVISPFFSSSKAIQQYDKWIKYTEPQASCFLPSH